jgi:predicted phage terminase large subunit-like protein
MNSLAAQLAALPAERREHVLEQLTPQEQAAVFRWTERLAEFMPRMTPRFAPPLHLQPLLDLIERSQYEEVRYVVHAPPRHVKTETILNAIAFLLGKRPEKTHGFVTYSERLSRSKSRKARTLARMNGVDLATDAQSLTEWRTTAGGGLIATGIGGPLTGQGIQGCFPGETPVETDVGSICIETLARLQHRPRVLAFNHETGRAEYRRIVAARRLEDRLVVVRTARGREIRATREHPFFVRESGYRPAALLRPGDRLVAVAVTPEQDVRAVRGGEEGARSNLPELLRHEAGDARHGDVREVQQADRTAPLSVREGATQRGSPVLLHESVLVGSRERGTQREGESASAPPASTVFRVLDAARLRDADVSLSEASAAARHKVRDADVSSVPGYVPPSVEPPHVLLADVRERGALGADDRVGQLALQDGNELREVVRQHAPADFSAGSRLCGLLVDAQAGRAPHQRGPAGQHSGEPCRDVQDLPRDPPQIEDDAVAAVEEVRGGRVSVYDLQVEGLSNFFAGQVLVHNCLWVDDPIKNRAEAESETIRESVWEWFNDVAFTRLEPGASCLVVQTRWHPQDLAGKLINERGWQYLKLPAIDGEGHALWPEQFPVERLQQIREQVGAYTWASLYQGEPRDKGGQVFGDVHIYDELPTLTGYTVSLGIDCAYTKKKSSDYSSIVTLKRFVGSDAIYVVNVQRLQIAVPLFKTRIDAEVAAYPRVRTRWYTSTTEAGLAEMLGIGPKLAKEDKFVRAQPVAAAWNAGKILVPRNAPWLDAFIAEVVSFTGVNDEHDDQVDALAAAYDEITDAVPTFSGLRSLTAPRRM